MMDSEPGRCRRTDGKKWRCHKSVVPNEKYCETHMHRGRKRSRTTLVETPTGSDSLNSQIPCPTNTNKRDSPNNVLNIKNTPVFDHKPQFRPNKNPISSDSSSRRGDNVAKEVQTTVLIRAPNFNGSVRVYKDDKQNNAGEFNDNVNKGIAIMNRSSGLDFPLDSVLQGALRHPSVEKCKLDLNSESERCRRTDGKKWRCSNKVLPHQKYCANHINRGVRKPITLISTSGNTKHAFGSSPGLNSNESEQTKLRLGLNIPYTSSSAVMNIEDDSMASSGESGSTTETTITDESVDVMNMITLSP